jgi:uncharacterized MAPEG superfamily protein
MRLLIPTFLILVGLALNHAWHGVGCWGYQPGGRLSSNLYFAQTLVSIYAIYVTLCLVARDYSIRNLMFGIAAIGTSTLAIVLVSQSWMHTSVHNQGIENLPPFLANSLIAILVGVQVVTDPKPPIRLASDCPACGYPLKQLPERNCPECGHKPTIARSRDHVNNLAVKKINL